MRCTVAATMLIAVLAVTVPRDGACAPDVGDTLMDMLDIRTAENRTAADYRIPGYMYALYRDTGNRQLLQRYDLIRSVSPQTGNVLDIFAPHCFTIVTPALGFPSKTWWWGERNTSGTIPYSRIFTQDVTTPQCVLYPCYYVIYMLLHYA
jgi:hypothetical protein